MNAFRAIMLEAYRELNSKKLFWITMILSGLIVLIFLFVGFDEDGVSIFGFGLGFGPNSTTIAPEVFFKGMFIGFGLNFWLAWIATVLALCTTAEIFPTLMSNGAIDMVLSKPIRRVSLFAMKFFSGLLFTGLQVAVFCGASFLVIGIKTGAWEPGLFLAVPLMMLFFSYLFAACVLFGVLTRSTIASLLLTLLVWFVIWIANTTDGSLIAFKAMNTQRVEAIESRLGRQDELIGLREQRAAEAPDDERRAEQLESARELKVGLDEDLIDATGTLETLDFWHGWVFVVKTALPKTGETVGLLERWLIAAADLQPDTPPDEPTDEEFDPDAAVNFDFGRFQPDEDRMNADIREEIRSRSVWWVIGTSLIFEFFLLGIAAWRFQRTDF